MKHWRDLSLRSKIFLCFGTLILLSTAAITLYAVSITISELDAYALQSMERNAQYVSREISALLRNTQMQSVLFASDKTVDEALAGYDAKTTLQKWESWSALQKNCTLWVATKQLGDIRIHFYASHQFLRDGIRFYEGVEKVSALARRQGERDAYWDLFSDTGCYSCLTPLVVNWHNMGYVEVQMSLAPLLEVMDTQSQTGMALSLTDGVQVLDAAGQVSAYNLGLALPQTEEMAYLHHDDAIFTVLRMDPYPFYLVCETSAVLISEKGVASLRSILMLLAAVLLGAFLLAWLTSRFICSRLERLKGAMIRVKDGERDVHVDDSSGDEFGQILRVFNQMAADLKTTTETALRNERISREAELRLLQAQINPHFINNTLESISWAAASHDDAHVQYLVRNLSAFLRASLSKTRQMYTVAREWQSIEAYWNIQQYRFGDRICLQTSLPPELSEVPILPMLLQPLVENALLHGLLCRPERGGCVRLSAERVEDLLIIEVEDDGVGMPPQQLKAVQSGMESQTAGSYGLWNVHQRVRTHYGEEYGLSLQSRLDEGTLCILTVPYIKHENE